MNEHNYFVKSVVMRCCCHIFTFFTVMVAIPFFCKGTYDIIWISMRVFTAVIIAVGFALKIPDISPIVYFLLSFVQDIMGFAFRRQISRLYGISLTPLGEFEYIGQIFIWITAVAILQTVVIGAVRYFKTKT